MPDDVLGRGLVPAGLRAVCAVIAALPPHFGPANAWLFGERDGKLRALCEAVGLTDPDACDAAARTARVGVELP